MIAALHTCHHAPSCACAVGITVVLSGGVKELGYLGPLVGLCPSAPFHVIE